MPLSPRKMPWRRKMGKNITQEDLVPVDFVSAIPSEEKVRGKFQPVLPLPKFRNKWNRNQGVTVIYDYEGNPWLRREDLSKEEQALLDLPPRDPAVWVPHSNDGGTWARQNLTF